MSKDATIRACVRDIRAQLKQIRDAAALSLEWLAELEESLEVEG